MEVLKIDRTKLKTVQNYAKMKGVTRQTVYNWIEKKEVITTEIDGVTFVVL
jgi:DNA invertase Pin-like site-specific DNA recombinase